MPFWKSQQDTPPPKHLPLPTGPHAVGYQDLMTPGGVKDGTFLRLFYPSNLPLNETINQHKRWPLWAEDEYLIGMVKFMQAILAKWPSWAPRGEFLFIDQISVLAPVIHIGCTHVWRLLNGEVFCPTIKNAEISKESKWPLVVFSHGLGTARFAYSRLCSDLASHGLVVAAVEHRDGSAAATFVVEEEQKKTWIPYRKILETEKEYTVRNEQLHQRVEEVRRCLDVVIQLGKGEPVENILPDADQFDLAMLKGAIEFSRPVMAGHSYGGATTLMTLAKEERFHHGLALDSWLFPLKDEVALPKQPIVFINTESFMNRDNIAKMKTFLKDGKDKDRRMIFVKGSVHQNLIDGPLIFNPGIVKRIMGFQSETSPVLVLDLYAKLMLHFIYQHLELKVDKDIVSFLEHHESILVEASEDAIGGDDADLVNITGGVVDKKEEKNNEDAEETS